MKVIYPRDLLATIKPFLRRKEFLAITGPRQSGKTTFLKIATSYLEHEMGIGKDRIHYVTFEDRRFLNEFEADPLAFIESYTALRPARRHYIMIDEFQHAARGGQGLKLIYDTVGNVKVIITGSSSLDIRAQVGKHMVGRVLTFNLFPFSFIEYLTIADRRLAQIYRRCNAGVSSLLVHLRRAKLPRGNDPFAGEMKSHFEKYCIWGGYPEVIMAKNTAVREKVLGDIYNNYMLKDVRTLLELATEKSLHALAQHLATQIGNLVVYQNLSQVTGLEFRKLKAHLSILEETFVCRPIRPFFRNRQKELTKNPKIYFHDTGLRNVLLDNFSPFEKRTDAGALVENAVFTRLSNSGLAPGRVYFWRTKKGAEVDFILRRGDDVVPVEIKYSSFETERISRSLASFIESFKPKFACVLNKNLWGMVRKNTTQVFFIPVYYV